MGKFREIEKKFFLHEETYHSARGKIDAFLEPQGGAHKETVGSGADTFWRVEHKVFVRVRAYDNCDTAGQLTLKAEDKGGIVDRLETNITLTSEEDLANAVEMCNTLYGDPIRNVWKKYHIFWLTDDANIVVYQTDKELPLILEVEGTNQYVVDALEKLAGDIFKLTPEDNSLFDIVGAIDG